MPVNIDTIAKLVASLTPDQRVKFLAYVLAPFIVLIIPFLYHFSGMTLDPGKSVVVSELKTETLSNGNTNMKSGVALIIDPEDLQFRVPLRAPSSALWTSLDEEEMYANKTHLMLDRRGFSGVAPLIGVKDPVTVILEGQLIDQIELSARKETLKGWRLVSKKANSALAGVLIICVFAFGFAFATVVPSVEGDQNATGKEGA
jgi:hypothetical protein